MAMQHISKLSADDFKAVVGQTFQVVCGDEVRRWILRDVETRTMTLGGESRCCGEGEKPPAKKKLDAKTVAKQAKAAVDAINANLEAIGYIGPKVKNPVMTVTLGYEGEAGKALLPEGEYSMFHEGLGTIEGVHINPTISKAGGDTPHYDVTYYI